MKFNKSEEKELAIVLFLSMLFIFSVIFTFYIFQIHYFQSNEFHFSIDEGRHQGFNESWYVGFHLTSDDNDIYDFFTVYGIDEEKRCHKLSVLTDVSSEDYFFNSYDEPSDDYHLDTSKLNITYDYFYDVDRWYQLEENPFSYHFHAGFLDRRGKPIILNCTLIENKGPIRMKDSFLNKNVFNDESNNLYYYAQTNIDVQGTLLLNGSIINVSGSAWIDRQWGDTLYPKKYEWFAIQLDNDYEIAAAKIRKNSQNISYALLITPSQEVVDVTEDVIIQTVQKTEDGFSKKWFICSDKGNFNLSIEAFLNDQIINFWPITCLFEGGCNVTGDFHDKLIEGNCFSEQNP